MEQSKMKRVEMMMMVVVIGIPVAVVRMMHRFWRNVAPKTLMCIARVGKDCHSSLNAENVAKADPLPL